MPRIIAKIVVLHVVLRKKNFEQNCIFVTEFLPFEIVTFASESSDMLGQFRRIIKNTGTQRVIVQWRGKFSSTVTVGDYCLPFSYHLLANKTWFNQWWIVNQDWIIDCELRSIAVLRMILLLLFLLLRISISQILTNNRSFQDWINNPVFLWNSDEIWIFNQQYAVYRVHTK